MISSHSQPDDLQSLWRGGKTNPMTEDYSIMLRIAQEKQHSLRDFLRGEDSATYMLTLCLAPLLAFATWRTGKIPIMQLGNLVLTLTLVVGALVTWINRLKANRLLELDLSVRDYQVQLLRFYDRQIRISKGIKYWCVIPLFFGFSLVGYPIAGFFHFALPWFVLAILALFAGFEYYTWLACDVKRVKDLKRRKDEMQSLLDEMDRAQGA